MKKITYDGIVIPHDAIDRMYNELKEIRRKALEEETEVERENKESCLNFESWWDCDTIGCKLTHCGTYTWECGKSICKRYEQKQGD